VCDLNGIAYTILVPHNIFGPQQKFDDPNRNVASIMANRILQGKHPIIYGTGEQKPCFSLTSDVVDPIKMILDSSLADGEIINIGTDSEIITVNELSQNIARILNFDMNSIYVPRRPL
jgi:UDP-glucose 4-epimerase